MVDENLQDSLTYEPKDIALPLLCFNPNQRKYELSPEALSMIRSLCGKISVITVAGLYRTGKSYLLNQVLLNRKSGFGVGPSINPCTKGMWIWDRPLTGKTALGDPCQILVIDTEGIGALDEDSTHDSRIFSLAILFSSCFIYNSVGSIDESALQSMSLVLNLAKNITVKSDNTSIEDLSSYFPNFLWVVRDFTLQLIDETGKQLTSKEYLEKALMPQKGNSEACEEKNKIRTMIKTFFKDRECYTLVRPTTDEAELQNLDQKELNTLRPEFIAQTKELRDHVINNLKTKELNGKALTGEMFCDLIESYVNSVNTGAAPCIESTWSYMCKNQVAKAMQEAENTYETLLSGYLQKEFPVTDKKILRMHKEIKHKCIQEYNSKAIGDNSEACLNKLKKKIKEKFEPIYLHNQDTIKLVSTRFLQENYGLILQKLKKGTIKSFLEYEKELKILKEYANNHCPVMNSELLGDFLIDCLSSTSDQFIKSLSNELNLQKDLQKENISRLESELKENRDNYYREREDLRLKLSSSENEKIELSLREKSASEKLEKLKVDKETYEKESRNTIKTLRAEFSEKLEEATKKCWEYEESIKELERKIFQTQSDSSQELALLLQKVGYLEKTLAEADTREQKTISDLKAYKLDHNNVIKEICSKQEEQLLLYQNRLLDETQKITELEKILCEKEVEFDEIKAKYDETQERLEGFIQQSKDNEEFNKNRFEQREKYFKQECERSIEKYENDLQHLKSQLLVAENKLKQYENSKLYHNAETSKETAILEQKIEFLEQELKDTRKSLEEEKKHQQNFLASMGTMALEASKDEIQEEIKKIQEMHDEELKMREENYNVIKNQLEKELVYYKEIVEELEIDNKRVLNNKSEKEKDFANEIEALRTEKTRLMEKIRCLNNEYSKFVEETEAKAKSKAKEIEERAENLISYYTRENSEIKLKSEEVIMQLKKYCEEDKSRNELRLREERERLEKKYQISCDDYEKKQQEDQERYDAEITNLQQELRELNERYNQEIQHLRHKSDFDSQKIETLENYLNSTKDQIACIQSAQAQSLETHLQAFNNERATLLDKIEKIASELAGKERENANYEFRAEQAYAKASLREKELEDLKEQYNRERGLLLERLEAAKQANHKLADEITQKKSDFKREIALANQHIEFQCKKIADLEKSLQETTLKYSDSFKSWRNESGQEFTETIEKLNTDKENAEKKLEENKKKIKDLELKYSKQISQLEKDKNLLSEKVLNLENKKTDTERRLNEEIKDLRSQLSCSKDFGSVGRSVYLVDNEKLKEKTNELEKSLAEMNACYERDKVLWTNKFGFLIQQRDQARSDLIDSQQKFDMALERLQKRGSLDRDKVGAVTASLVSSVEARYSTQIKEIHEKYTTTIADLSQKNKTLERELRNVKDLDRDKSQLFLEHEKERAKWTLERELLVSQKNEAQDSVDKLEKRRETLARENEKLKATRGRVSSSKIDSVASVNKSYMTGILNNISFDEVTKEPKNNLCLSPTGHNHDSSPMPLKFKNYEGPKPYSSFAAEPRKSRKNFDENSRS